MEKHTDEHTNSGNKEYFYPNRMGRVVLQAMEEILGDGGVNAVLNLADFPANANDHPSYKHDKKIPLRISAIYRLASKAFTDPGPAAAWHCASAVLVSSMACASSAPNLA